MSYGKHRASRSTTFERRVILSSAARVTTAVAATPEGKAGRGNGGNGGSGAYERRSLAIGPHRPFEQWGRFLPEQTTAVSIRDRLLHHATVVITDGQSYRMKDGQHRKDRP